MFVVNPTNLEKLKSDIRTSKNRRLHCRRAVNRLLSGGGDSIEVTGKLKEGKVYDIDMIVTLPKKRTTTIQFALNICSDSIENIYKELKAAGIAINNKIREEGEDSLGKNMVDLRDFVALLVDGKDWRQLYCRKLSEFIRNERKNFKFEPTTVGRFKVAAETTCSLLNCNKVN